MKLHVLPAGPIATNAYLLTAAEWRSKIAAQLAGGAEPAKAEGPVAR